MENGRSWPENNFAQINLAADSATDFAMNFYKPGTMEPFVIPDGAPAALSLRHCLRYLSLSLSATTNVKGATSSAITSPYAAHAPVPRRLHLLLF